MKNEARAPALKTEQLYSETFFAGFCEQDAVGGKKLGRRIDANFLDACQKEELIVPFFTRKEQSRMPNAPSQEVDVRYYSPFQIYLVAALAENIIDEDGNLRSDWSVDWQKQQKTRFINWGGGGFNADTYKARKGEREADGGIRPNYYEVADDFHNFLRLLHGLDEEKDWSKKDRDRSRYFQRQPALQYNLDPLKENPSAYLALYDLDASKLKALTSHIAYTATDADPLERWYYYIRRHSQWRRDLFKGKAALAQDLYGLCDILYEIIEVASGEKLPPLLDYVHPDIKPYLLETAGQAEGSDIKAVQEAHRKLRDWVATHKELVAEITPFYFRGEAGTKERLDEAIERLGRQLADYEKRYGDKRHMGSGWRILEPEATLKLEDLDDRTRQYAEGITRQHVSVRKDEDGKTHFTTSFDDIAERLQKKEITLEQAQEEDRARNLQYEITRAIESTLDDLSRSVMSISGGLAEAMWGPLNQAEQEKKMAEPRAWSEFGQRVRQDAADYRVQHTRFAREGIKEYTKTFDEKIEKYKRAQRELHYIARCARLVFCAVCREKPVQKHYGYNDGQVSNEAVCDECFSNAAKMTLEATEEDWKKIKYAEWKCDGCRERTLIKYALENVVSLETKGKVPIQVALEYGRMTLQAKCPKCGTISSRAVDWGWHP